MPRRPVESKNRIKVRTSRLNLRKTAQPPRLRIRSFFGLFVLIVSITILLLYRLAVIVASKHSTETSHFVDRLDNSHRLFRELQEPIPITENDQNRSSIIHGISFVSPDDPARLERLKRPVPNVDLDIGKPHPKNVRNSTIPRKVEHVGKQNTPQKMKRGANRTNPKIVSRRRAKHHEVRGSKPLPEFKYLFPPKQPIVSNATTLSLRAPKIVTTRFGWNSENQTIQKNSPRTWWGWTLFQMAENHPWGNYNNEGSHEEEKSEGDRHEIILLDFETCFETQWSPPHASHKVEHFGFDVRHRRPYINKKKINEAEAIACSNINSTTNLSLKQENRKSNRKGGEVELLRDDQLMVIFHCRGNMKKTPCLKRQSRERLHQYNNMVVVALSTQEHDMRPGWDMGLPPVALNPVELSAQEVALLSQCNETRRWLYSFVGRVSSSPIIRPEIVALHDRKKIFAKDTSDLIPGEDPTFHELLRSSTFVACPRGDNLFSYRFSEILSAGAIPVLYRMHFHWMLPFNNDIVDWNDVTVTIDMNEVNRTPEVLEAIPQERICQMRQNAYKMYRDHIQSPMHMVNTILQAVEIGYQRRKRNATTPEEIARIKEEVDSITPHVQA